MRDRFIMEAKHTCSVCQGKLNLTEIFLCMICNVGICNECKNGKGNWIHIKDDCDLCYQIICKDKIDILSHTLYFVCSPHCENILQASYY